MSAGLYVLFRVGDAEYAVSASEVVQLDAYDQVTPVPNAREGVIGVVQVRGRVLPVIDVRVRVGLAAAEPTPDTRLVVVRLGERVVALRVDRARELVRLEPEQVEPPPASPRGRPRRRRAWST